MIRIAAVGDIHVSERTRGWLRPHWMRLAAEADVLLLAGDLTDRGTTEQARILADELRDLPVPAVAVLGNHDCHADDAPAVRRTLEEVGLTMLEGESITLKIGVETVGIAGVKGFGGGLPGASAHKFGEREMKAFVEAAEREAQRLEASLSSVDADYRIALMHYAPIKDTLVGEPLELYPFLGAWQLAQAIDRPGADLAIHGHAHYGSPQGRTAGGVPVYNVAMPLIRRPYVVFTLGAGE
jgi:Icc-related predicted phosphoesterase